MKYVVQMFLRDANDKDREIAGLAQVEDKPPLPGTWTDIAEVDVEPRTKRSTVIKKALAESDIKPEGKVRLRVLDAESAEVYEPEAVQPPMEWKLP